MRRQPGFFDIDDRLKRLSNLGDQLETFRTAVDFELFRPELNAALSYTDRTEGGRPPFDPVLIFKILVIQATNNLSDERAEFLINDRLSFMRFLGLGLEDRVPDARTIWLFRQKLTTAGAIKRLFEQFDAMLRQAGYIAMSGQIVDGTLVAAPRQRNTDDEKRMLDGQIHQGQTARGWLDAASRSGNPALWLSEPCLYGPAARCKPKMMIWRSWSCASVSGLLMERLSSWPSWISARRFC